jgi:hypothetical protein
MSHPSFGYSKKMWQTLCLMPKKNEFGFGLFELSPVPLFIWMCQDFTVGPNLRQWYQENKSTIFGGFTVQPSWALVTTRSFRGHDNQSISNLPAEPRGVHKSCRERLEKGNAFDVDEQGQFGNGTSQCERR